MARGAVARLGGGWPSGLLSWWYCSRQRLVCPAVSGRCGTIPRSCAQVWGGLAGGRAHCAAMVLEAEEGGSGGVPPVTSWSSLPCRTGRPQWAGLASMLPSSQVDGNSDLEREPMPVPAVSTSRGMPDWATGSAAGLEEVPTPYNPGRGLLSGTQDHRRLEPHSRGSTPPSTGVTPGSASSASGPTRTGAAPRTSHTRPDTTHPASQMRNER